MSFVTQPCWSCAKACGGCSWSDKLLPVDGWEAERRVTTKREGGWSHTMEFYKILSCPEYVQDSYQNGLRRKSSEKSVFSNEKHGKGCAMVDIHGNVLELFRTLSEPQKQGKDRRTKVEARCDKQISHPFLTSDYTYVYQSELVEENGVMVFRGQFTKDDSRMKVRKDFENGKNDS